MEALFSGLLPPWNCPALEYPEVAQTFSTTIGPTISDSKPEVLCIHIGRIYTDSEIKFPFFVYLHVAMIKNHCICQYYGMLQSLQTPCESHSKFIKAV